MVSGLLFVTWDSNCNKITSVITEESTSESKNTQIFRDSRIELPISCENCKRVPIKYPVPGTLRNNCGIPYVK